MNRISLLLLAAAMFAPLGLRYTEAPTTSATLDEIAIVGDGGNRTSEDRPADLALVVGDAGFHGLGSVVGDAGKRTPLSVVGDAGSA